MISRLSRLCFVLSFVTAAVGCTKSSPTQPSGSGGSSPSIVAPSPVTPANNAAIANAAQPVTLAVQNAVTTGSAPTYKFEVASDPSFNTILQTKDQVAQGSGSQTSVTLDALPAAKDYYWHARASAGSTTGVYGGIYHFAIGAAFTLSTPGLVAPANAASTAGWPKFIISNSSRSGAVGTISYRFEIARDSGFNQVILSPTVAEGAGQTTYSPIVIGQGCSGAPPSQTLFWRVTAIDANGFGSATSTAQSFTPANTTQSNLTCLIGQIMWDGQQPPGTNGHAALGDGWDPQVMLYEPTHIFFNSPSLEGLQLFDLLDRGMTPDGAIGWMQTHGYPTNAFWYPPPEKAVIGLQYVYIGCVANGAFGGPCNASLTNGHWDVILRVE